ncbi:MAG: FHA domain-containing protein [Candidatus Aenigmarchaeota archaeon]|nr:FHA domain-containing protein [Candidatus Aenigmarchaeota archaeon]
MTIEAHPRFSDPLESSETNIIPKVQLVHIGTSSRYETKVFPIKKDVTTIGRIGDIQLPREDWVHYLGEGHDEKGVKKVIQTSREHARILKQDGKFTIEDVGSKVGTYVNGKKLGKPQKEPWKTRFCHSDDYYTKREQQIREANKGSRKLHDGDEISFGREIYAYEHLFRFEVKK